MCPNTIHPFWLADWWFPFSKKTLTVEETQLTSTACVGARTAQWFNNNTDCPVDQLFYLLLHNEGLSHSCLHVDFQLFLLVSCRRCRGFMGCQGHCYNPYGPCTVDVTAVSALQHFQGGRTSLTRMYFAPLLLWNSQCAIVYNSLDQQGLPHFKGSEKFLLSKSIELIDVCVAFGSHSLCQI